MGLYKNKYLINMLILLIQIYFQAKNYLTNKLMTLVVAYK
jgi:hypothetical protein